MIRNQYTYTNLVRVLKKEIAVHQRYLELLQEQRGYLIRFQTEKMQALDDKRRQYNQEIKKLHEERLAIMVEIGNPQGKKLTELVEHSFSKSEQKTLMPLIRQLKDIVTETKKQSLEFQGVTNFALNMVHGSISLLWQATQNVTKHYSPTGKLQESYSPTRSRHERVLKQA